MEDEGNVDDDSFGSKKVAPAKLSTKQAFSGYLLTLGSTKLKDSNSKKRKRDEEADAIRRASEQDVEDREAKRQDINKRREHEHAM